MNAVDDNVGRRVAGVGGRVGGGLCRTMGKMGVGWACVGGWEDPPYEIITRL